MIMTTTDSIPNRKITEILGIVRGNSVRAKHIGKDIVAGLKGIIGGEIKQYTELLSEAREEAITRMFENAYKLNADAILNVRFTTSMISPQMSELLAYGTAVSLE